MTICDEQQKDNTNLVGLWYAGEKRDVHPNFVFRLKFIFNPLVPIAHNSARTAKISILKKEGITKKKFL